MQQFMAVVMLHLKVHLFTITVLPRAPQKWAIITISINPTKLPCRLFIQNSVTDEPLTSSVYDSGQSLRPTELLTNKKENKLQKECRMYHR